MVLDPRRLIAFDFPEIEQELTARDASLYALGVGLGDAPLDPERLKYINEQDPAFRAAPTQPTTMGFQRWVLRPEFGADVTRVVHGEERLTLHRPAPTAGRIRAKLRILGVADKGEGRGAVVSARREIRGADGDAPFAPGGSPSVRRGEGGCGDAGEVARLGGPGPGRAPDRA
ncbi:MAG: MaoC family dehydratase N-terminal domain-containing protein, partial [Pikeienuella sp.]